MEERLRGEPKERLRGIPRSYDFNNFHGCFLFSEKTIVTMSPIRQPSPVEGERLTLSCQANEATKETRLRCTKNAVSVTTRANVQQIGNNVNSTLVIEKVLTSDSGRYCCKAINKADSACQSHRSPE